MPITNQLDINNLIQAFSEHNFVPPGIVGQFGVFRNNRIVAIRGHDWFRTRSAAMNSLNRFISENIHRQYVPNAHGSPVTAYQVFGVTVELHEELPPSDSYIYSLRENSPVLYERIVALFEIRRVTEEDVVHLAVPVQVNQNG